MQENLYQSIAEASELLERVTQIIYAFRLNPNYVPEDQMILNKFEQLAFASRDTANPARWWPNVCACAAPAQNYWEMDKRKYAMCG